jgi:putative Mn2+ efflux pump MntP
VDITSIIVIGVGVSLDCFAVAIAGSISMRRLSHVQILRASVAFGLFQAAMLVLGWLLGQTVVDLVQSFAHWLAFGLLLIVGGRMLKEAFEDEESRGRTDITRGFALLALSVATSIDSMAVGLSLAFLESRVLIAAPAVGAITLAFSLAGFYGGKRIGLLLGRWAEVAGGLALIGIGIRVLLVEVL